MQIHVQNAPFVYNPDTISVGLGFSKERGAKKLTGGMQYIKNISELCSVCLSLAAFTCYTTSKTWRLGGGHLLQTYFDQLLFVTVRLVCGVLRLQIILLTVSQEFTLLQPPLRQFTALFSTLQRFYLQSHLYYSRSKSTPKLGLSGGEEVRGFQ